MTIGLFEATKITRQNLAMNLNKLLYSFGLRKKIIAFVKNEGTNWNAMISTLMFVVSYDIMGLEKVSMEVVWILFFSKACYYGTTKEKVCKDMRFISIKNVHYLAKKSSKGKQKWNKAHTDVRIHPKKLNTPIKTMLNF